MKSSKVFRLFSVLCRTDLLFAFLFISCHFTDAQNIQLEKKADRIDSLMTMYYSNYEQANSEANELYDLLTVEYSEKIYKKVKVRVMLQKAIIYALNGDHHKALEISLRALDEAERYKLPDKIYNSCWVIAIMYEVGGDFDLCKKYLDKAYKIYKGHKLDSVFASYCTRTSSYYTRVNKNDSAVYYAYKGLEYAKKYQNNREERDAYLLLGSALPDNKYRESVKYRSLAARKFLEIKDFTSAASQLTDAGTLLLKHNNTAEAFIYSDSAFLVLRNTSAYVNPHVYQLRYQLFEAAGNMDSAFYYFNKYHDSYVSELVKMETAEIKKINEQYQNDKKEDVIKSKNQQMVFIASLLAAITIAVSLLVRTNRKMKKQNTIIGKQVEELMRILDQKQVLMSELQHRVKNNLQHVISILEIQKESVDFSNIDELVRENQNRIHSMALLHSRLNTTEDINVVNLREYLTGLSDLVRDSYGKSGKEINLILGCEIEHISIEKALPIGLIMVELISNSIKHAFGDRDEGTIGIALRHDEDIQKNALHYWDDGKGFDFNLKNRKGLGLEIIKGLADQLNGRIVSDRKSGFELWMYF